MKIIILFSIVFVLLEPCFAGQNFFLGVENSRFAYAGYALENVGAQYKQSVFIQDVDLQYWETSVFFRTTIKKTNLMISPYYGARFNQDFYKFGNSFAVETNYKFPINYYIKLSLDYDSILKFNAFFTSTATISVYSYLHLVAGIKNSPEYRQKEKRVIGGILLQDDHSSIMPYISRPYGDDDSTTRFNLDFRWNL